MIAALQQALEWIVQHPQWALALLFLLVRPAGLFGERAIERV